jgi:hypothetical protein
MSTSLILLHGMFFLFPTPVSDLFQGRWGRSKMLHRCPIGFFLVDSGPSKSVYASSSHPIPTVGERRARRE